MLGRECSWHSVVLAGAKLDNKRKSIVIWSGFSFFFFDLFSLLVVHPTALPKLKEIAFRLVLPGREYQSYNCGQLNFTYYCLLLVRVLTHVFNDIIFALKTFFLVIHLYVNQK